MAAPTFEGIIRELKNKVYHPVYFLHGDEPWYIDKIADFIDENILSESEKEFNQTIVYGRDVDLTTILNNAKRYPMMANYQVVIVREAQDVKDLFKKKKDDDKDGADADQLSEYLENPQKSTVLVFCYKHKKIDRRTKSVKVLEKNAVCFESKQIYSDKIPAWISGYVKERGFSIKADAALLLSEYLGTELSKVSNELEKLMINLEPKTEINTTHIEKNIGISKDYNVFELQNALGARNTSKIYRIVNYFGANPKANPMILTVATLFQFFNKLVSYHIYRTQKGVNLSAALGVNPYFMKDYDIAARNYSLDHCINAISLLHEYDLKAKGVNNYGASDDDLLRELLFKIMHPEQLAV